MRMLSDQFIKDLHSPEGMLQSLLQRVIIDPSLCLEIRSNYVNIYYRGSNLLRISEKSKGSYEYFFDVNYALGPQDRADLSAKIAGLNGIDDWLKIFPELKHFVDLYLGHKNNEEREAQQLILRANNFGKISNATDFYILDIEYADREERFDMIATHWPSNAASRKKPDQLRLAFIEVKYGDKALGGSAGVRKHIKGIVDFISEQERMDDLKKEMIQVLKLKRQLGLINCPDYFIKEGNNKTLGFTDEKPPLLILVLVDHDPDSTKLKSCLSEVKSCLSELKPSPAFDLRIATSCFMGYGLFDIGLKTVEEVERDFPKYLCTKK